MLSVSGLFIYPIKSLGGIAVPAAKVTDRGFEYDRRWMLVDEGNTFLSQRTLPNMAHCRPRVTADGLVVSYPQMDDSPLIPFVPEAADFTDVLVWNDTCRAQYVGSAADAWFSQVLDMSCRLVYMPDDSLRPVDPEYAPADKINSFSDGYPFLLISEASLADLSSRTGETIPMDRFRPNIVFSGGTPYMEDEMTHFRIAGISFYGVKLCARCPIPGIDQSTATRVKEPLKTLNTYRRKQGKVWIGQNLIHNGSGNLQVGDAVEVLEMASAAVFDLK